MLSLEPPFLQIGGITVFRDHALEDQYYYLAPHPTIARVGGAPMLDLFAYTVDLQHSPLTGTTIPDEMGAGFLNLGVGCELRDATRRGIRQEIAGRTARPVERIALVPVPYSKGKVTVIALDRFTGATDDPASPASEDRLKGRPTFVEEIVGLATPSLMNEDLRAIFSLRLSQHGVAFLQGLFSERAAPVGVIYELEFYGLRPSIEVEIDANLSRIFTHFGGGLGAQYAWFGAEVSAGLDYLAERGDIQVRLTSQAVGEEAQKSKELALSIFKDRIVQEMFRPTGPQGQVPAVAVGAAAGTTTAGASAGASSNSSPQTSLVRLTLNLQRTYEDRMITYSFAERAPEKRVHSPQAFLPLLVDKSEFERHVHLINLDHEFFKTLDVLLTGPTPQEFDNLRIRQVEAKLTYGQPGDAVPPESASLLFRRDSTGDKPFRVGRRGRKTLAYSYSLFYDFIDDPALDSEDTAFAFEDRPSTRRTLLINPTNDFGVLQVEVVPGRIDPGIKAVDVDLAYRSRGGAVTAQQHYRFDLSPAAANGPMKWQVRTRDREIAPYTAEYTFYFHDNAVYAAPAVEQTEPLLRVDSPFRSQRRLLIRANVVSTTITKMTVEVEYDDPAAPYRRRMQADMTAPFETTTLAWPILDAARQKIRYRVTAHEPGFISEGTWLETDEPSILIGAQGSRLAKIGVTLIGPAVADAGLDALMVKLRPAGAADDAETVSLLFEPGGVRVQEARLRMAPGAPLRYEVQTTFFKATGQMVESAWREETSPSVVISTRIT